MKAWKLVSPIYFTSEEAAEVNELLLVWEVQVENGRIAWKLEDGKVGCVGSLSWGGGGRGEEEEPDRQRSRTRKVVDIVA